MPIPPPEVRRAAKRGLEARDKAPPSRKGMTRVGLARANQLINGDNLSISTIRRMFSYLSRAKPNYDRAKAQGRKPEDSPATQAYLGWGGNAGLAWARRILNNL